MSSFRDIKLLDYNKLIEYIKKSREGRNQQHMICPIETYISSYLYINQYDYSRAQIAHIFDMLDDLTINLINEYDRKWNKAHNAPD